MIRAEIQREGVCQKRVEGGRAVEVGKEGVTQIGQMMRVTCVLQQIFWSGERQ